ncbi:MAG: lipid-transfer protein [Pseudomonadota bacterium]|nr:lipid-transfer protein [Pseudomonadota bacterium]
MSREAVILGVGMHPWGKWGRNFVEYGVHAARAALKDAGVSWQDVGFVSGAGTVRCGYPGYVAGGTFAQALGWQGAEVNTSYAACASGAQALAAARAKIRAGDCEVALVVGADTTPKGFLAPAKGYRPDDPDWVRFHIGITNPTYFALYARRRMALYGATERDFTAIKVKNAAAGVHNPNARYRKAFTAEEVDASAMVADPLRLLQICATSDGGAAVIVASADYAKRIGAPHPVHIAAISTVTPRYASGELEMPDIATDSAAVATAHSFRASLARKAYEEAGIGPDEVSLAEVYDLASSMELDWYEYLELCAPGQAEELLRSGATALGGRIPVNPSGGLASFGEAVPAQALAQVCELVWQLRGQAGARQVPNAQVGITANQGLFGHGSSVLLKR